eukprot:10826000-Ditylum_brightwellii.AAC.1
MAVAFLLAVCAAAQSFAVGTPLLLSVAEQGIGGIGGWSFVVSSTGCDITDRVGMGYLPKILGTMSTIAVMILMLCILYLACDNGVHIGCRGSEEGVDMSMCFGIGYSNANGGEVRDVVMFGSGDGIDGVGSTLIVTSKFHVPCTLANYLTLDLASSGPGHLSNGH